MRSCIVLLVDTSLAQILNQLRSASFDSSDRRTVLGAIDSIEAIFTRHDHTIGDLHQRLAHQQAGIQKQKEYASSNVAQEASELRSENQTLRTELAEITRKLCEEWQKSQRLEEQLRLMTALRFGRSRERFTDEDSRQGLLFNEAELLASQAAPEDEELEEACTEQAPPAQSPSTRKPRGKRAPLPANLKVVEKHIELEGDACSCGNCGKALTRIGEEVSEHLEHIPAQFIKHRIIRGTYACNCSSSTVQNASPPPRIFPKSIMGDSVLASIITNKYCDALPFYRQERIFARSDIALSRQTMARGAISVAKWLEPLLQLFDQRLSQCRVLCADETRLRVLKENGIKKESNSYMWVACGEDDRGKIVKFHYGGGRDAKVARDVLGTFQGILMCDAYGAYPSASTGTPIQLAACMAHVRRKFHDVIKANSRDEHGRFALNLIQKLYKIEQTAAFYSAEARRELRQKEALPLLEMFQAWLVERVQDTAPKTNLGIAVHYTMKIIDRLKVYLDNDEVPIDNNRAENAIRPFVVGRKNWLFNAEADGARASSALYTVIESAKANYLEPMHYLQFLFRCHQHFGSTDMPWEKLQPTPLLRSIADELCVNWSL